MQKFNVRLVWRKLFHYMQEKDLHELPPLSPPLIHLYQPGELRHSKDPHQKSTILFGLPAHQGNLCGITH